MPDTMASLWEGVTSPGEKLPATHDSQNAYHLTALHLGLHFQPHDLGLFIPIASEDIGVQGLQHSA